MSIQQQALKIIYALHDERSIKNYQELNALRKNAEFLALENKIGELTFENAKNKAYGRTDINSEKIIADLNKELLSLSTALGYDYTAITTDYNCPYCKDKGFINNFPCSCLKNKTVELQYLQNPQLLRIPDSLSKLDFSVYGENKDFFLKCAKKLEATIVNKGSERSFFTLSGEVGVGKSFLAFTTARQCLDNGASVQIINALEINKLFLTYHLANLNAKAQIFTDINSVDLLIIDDLGIEPIYKNVTVPYLYQLLIERMGKKTIITTNLSLTQIADKYDERLLSRLVDKQNSIFIPFVGKDLRLNR